MRYTTALLGAIATVSLALPAHAERLTSWYGAIEGGANWVEDFELEQYVTPFGPPPATSTLSEDPGWAVLGAIGYSFDNNWRLEAEGGYRHNQFESLTPLGAGKVKADGETHQYTLMANVLFDLTSKSGAVLSLGGGAGADYIRAKSPAFASGADADDVSFALQAIAGLSMPIASSVDMTLNYRFLYVPKVNAEDDSTVPGSVLHADTTDLKQHTVSLGFRFGGRAQPVVALAPEAPLPPPPPVARQYIVFFGFNKCNITANADQVLSEAASAAQKLGSASIAIAGHTDTVGSPGANKRLSTCRATATKTNLVSKGVSASSIVATGLGEGQLLIQTDDGVKEPQNRRATVELN